MIWFCESIYWFPACCARPGCVSGPTLYFLVRLIGLLRFHCVRLFDVKIFDKCMGPSMGNRLFFLRTTRDPLGSHWDSKVKRYEALRCRLITEVRVRRVFEYRAETSGFYGADVFSDSETSPESVVLSHVRDANYAPSFRWARCGQVEILQQVVERYSGVSSR